MFFVDDKQLSDSIVESFLLSGYLINSKLGDDVDNIKLRNNCICQPINNFGCLKNYTLMHSAN